MKEVRSASIARPPSFIPWLVDIRFQPLLKLLLLVLGLFIAVCSAWKLQDATSTAVSKKSNDPL